MTPKALAAFLVALTLVTAVTVAGVVLMTGAASACVATLSPGSPSTRPSPRGSTSEPATESAAAVSACSGPVLARAETWLTAWRGGPVPYLSSNDPATWLNGYRRDCSGYASMALGLPGPGLDTASLAARSTPITKAELLPGDLLINPAPDRAGHVVVFDSWTDTTMTRYLGFEQSGDGGTHHRVIPYPYFGGYLMNPYRWGN